MSLSDAENVSLTVDDLEEDIIFDRKSTQKPSKCNFTLLTQIAIL